MRSLLVRKKKFFFIGGIVALLIVAGAVLVNKLQPQEASATSSENVNLVINGSGAESYFTMNDRRAWCITPNWVNPDSGDHLATVYDLSEFKNATSGQMLRIKRMFTAYYWASNNINGKIDGQTDGKHSVTNNDGMHWALAYLYEGYEEYPSDGLNAKAIFDFYKKGLPDNLATGYVSIIPDAYRSDGKYAQAIFTADYTVKTSFTQKLEVKKVWRDGIDANSHNVSIKFKVKDTTTNSYITIDNDEIGELNAGNYWTFTKYFERDANEAPHSFSVEEIINPNDEGFHVFGDSIEGQPYWYHDNIKDDRGNSIYYIMPSDATESCDESDPYHVTCTMYNVKKDLQTVNLWPTKRWEDSGYTEYRPESIEYIIHAFVQVNGVWHEVEGLPHTGVELPQSNAYSLENTYVWGGVYVAGMATHAEYPADGGEMYPVTYAIEEVASSVPSAYGLSCGENFVYENKTYCLASQKNDNSGDYEVEWTNSIGKITVTANKHWNDGGNAAKRPYAVAFKIFRSVNGGASEYYKTAYMVKTWYGTRNDWSLSISLVEKDQNGNDYNYTYQETDYYNRGTDTYTSDDYIIDGQEIGFTTGENTGMVNTAKTSIPVKKCFIDEDKTKRPRELDFELYIGDATRPIENIVLTAANEGEDGCWTGEFDKLPAYDDDGNAIVYRVEEDDSELTNYALDEDFSTCEINAGDNFAADDDEKDGCVFYNVQLVDIPVKKVWAEDKKEDRPGSIEVSLLCGETILDTVTLSEENNLDGDNTWEYTWKNRRIDECEQGYSVAENINVPGYATKITGNAEDGFVITNTKTLDEILTWGSLGAGSFGAIAAGFFIVKRKLFDR